MRPDSRVPRFAVVAALVGQILFAQALLGQGRTFIVDSQNRPGTDFTELPAAVGAARDGDILRVRDGSYSGFSTAKSLSILGEPGAQLSGSFFPEVIRIVGLPRGASFVIEGLELLPSSFTGALAFIAVTDSPGRVLVENVVVDAGSSRTLGPALQLTSAAQVSVSECRFLGAHIAATDSTLLISDSELVGNPSPGVHPGFQGKSAIEATRSEVIVSRGSVQGGSAFGLEVPAPGMLSTAAAITVTGDTTTAVRAGGGVPFDVPAVRGTGSLILHPVVRLVPNGNAPPVSGGIVVTQRSTPSLSAIGAPPGGVVTVDLFSDVGDSVFLFAGLPGDKIPIPGLGDVWLDPNGIVPVVSGVQGPSRHFAFRFTAPSGSALVGLWFSWQAVAVDVGAGSVALSNRSSYVHD